MSSMTTTTTPTPTPTTTTNWAVLKAADPLQYYRQFLSKGLRPDGRTLLQRRHISIRAGAVTTANGSCLTKIGATSVLAAIKLEVSAPLNATPTAGFLEVSVQLTPLCSPRFKVGKPSDEAFALQQHLQRILVGGHVIDLEQLCIEEGKAVWNVKLDVLCLNHDGGCDDAALLAAVGALKNLTLPRTITKVEDANQSSRGIIVEIDDNDNNNNKGAQNSSTQLSIGGMPMPLTYGRFEGKWIVDPTAEEEEWMDSTVTVVVGGGERSSAGGDSGEEDRVYSVYKPGGASIPSDFIDEALASARNISMQAWKEMLAMDQ